METTRPSIIARPEPRTAAELSRARKIPTKSHPVVRSRRPSRRPDLHTARRRAQRQSRMAEGHREAAPRVLDGREHGGSLAAEGRRPITRHIAVYPRKLTAANNRLDRGGITAVLPASASGSSTRASASNALSPIRVSASIVGSRWSAPTRSCASPPVRKNPIGLPSASTRACILVLSPPRERPIAWSSPAFFGRRHYAGGRAQLCCRSSHIRCRRLRRDAETPAPTHRFWPNG